MSAHCLVCARPLAEPLESCPRCGAAYHRECLAYVERCARYGCAPAAAQPQPKSARITLSVDDPRRLFACWIAGGCGILGLACAALAAGPGLLLLAVSAAAGYRAGAIEAYRVVDPKSRVIWRHRRSAGGEQVEPEVRFDDCRALILRRQFALDSAGENCRWVLDVELVTGEWLILGDGVEVDAARAVGELIGLEVQRV